MEEWEILSFLKKDILPSHLREFILPLDSTDEVFRMIDSHFGNPYSEIKSIKDHIIGQSILPDDFIRSDYLSSRMRHIQKYLILLIKHAEPYGKLTIHDVSQSLMTWVPRCKYTSQLMRYKETIVSMSESDNVSLAQSYLNLITDEAKMNAFLQSCEISFKQKESCQLRLPIQNEQSSELESICEQKQIISCLLCSKKHQTHKCPHLYKLRDSMIDKPNELCPTHCGRKTNKCLEKECHLYHNRNGKIFNLTCQGRDTHGISYYVLNHHTPPKAIKSSFLKGKNRPR